MRSAAKRRNTVAGPPLQATGKRRRDSEEPQSPDQRVTCLRQCDCELRTTKSITVQVAPETRSPTHGRATKQACPLTNDTTSPVTVQPSLSGWQIHCQAREQGKSYAPLRYNALPRGLPGGAKVLADQTREYVPAKHPAHVPRHSRRLRETPRRTTRSPLGPAPRATRRRGAECTICCRCARGSWHREVIRRRTNDFHVYQVQRLR